METTAFVTATLDALGTVLIGVAALSVHRKVLREQKISSKVFHVMKAEQLLGFVGIGVIS